MSSFYVRAIGHAGATRWSSQPCVCICASDSASKRIAMRMHMYERSSDEAHSRASAHVRALQGEAHSRASAYVQAVLRRIAQPCICTCACTPRRSAQPCICICTSDAATNRTTAHLHMYKRLQDEAHNCAYAHVQAPKDQARSHAHVRATIGEVRSRTSAYVQAVPQRIA